jgi:hypothetical protein
MQKFFMGILLLAAAVTSFRATGQEDKSKRVSPPDSVSQSVNGTLVSVNYSSPSLRGRVMGVSVEPFKAKVWRAGANEATIFEVSKNVTVEGKPLPAGKYSLFMLNNPDNSWTIIFNRDWNMWGTLYEKNKDQDLLHVTVQPGISGQYWERLTYTISPEGEVSLLWGRDKISFRVQ